MREQISKESILRYIDSWSYVFNEEEKESICNKVCTLIQNANPSALDYQDWNSVEDAFTDAACCYFFMHDNSVQALLEADDEQIIACMGFGKPELEEVA